MTDCMVDWLRPAIVHGIRVHLQGGEELAESDLYGLRSTSFQNEILNLEFQPREIVQIRQCRTFRELFELSVGDSASCVDTFLSDAATAAFRKGNHRRPPSANAIGSLMQILRMVVKVPQNSSGRTILRIVVHDCKFNGNFAAQMPHNLPQVVDHEDVQGGLERVFRTCQGDETDSKYAVKSEVEVKDSDLVLKRVSNDSRGTFQKQDGINGKTSDPWSGMTSMEAKDITISSEQQELLDRDESWIPPEPGRRAPQANLPIAILESLQRRPSSLLKEVDSSEHSNGIGTSLVEDSLKRQNEPEEVHQDKDSGSDNESENALEWESSPPRHMISHNVPPPSSDDLSNGGHLRNGLSATERYRGDQSPHKEADEYHRRFKRRRVENESPTSGHESGKTSKTDSSIDQSDARQHWQDFDSRKSDNSLSLTTDHGEAHNDHDRFVEKPFAERQVPLPNDAASSQEGELEQGLPLSLRSSTQSRVPSSAPVQVSCTPASKPSEVFSKDMSPPKRPSSPAHQERPSKDFAPSKLSSNDVLMSAPSSVIQDTFAQAPSQDYAFAQRKSGMNTSNNISEASTSLSLENPDFRRFQAERHADKSTSSGENSTSNKTSQGGPSSLPSFKREALAASEDNIRTTSPISIESPQSQQGLTGASSSQTPKGNARKSRQDIYERFKSSYGDFTGTLIQFVQSCAYVEWLHQAGKMVPESCWDDFVLKHVSEYPAWSWKRYEEGEEFVFPEEYYKRFAEKQEREQQTMSSHTLLEALQLDTASAGRMRYEKIPLMLRRAGRQQQDFFSTNTGNEVDYLHDKERSKVSLKSTSSRGSRTAPEAQSSNSGPTALDSAADTDGLTNQVFAAVEIEPANTPSPTRREIQFSQDVDKSSSFASDHRDDHLEQREQPRSAPQQSLEAETKGKEPGASPTQRFEKARELAKDKGKEVSDVRRSASSKRPSKERDSSGGGGSQQNEVSFPKEAQRSKAPSVKASNENPKPSDDSDLWWKDKFANFKTFSRDFLSLKSGRTPDSSDAPIQTDHNGVIIPPRRNVNVMRWKY